MKPNAQIVCVGCGSKPRFCKTPHTSSDIITIDSDDYVEPDILMDITKSTIDESLAGKFRLTILEYLPYDAFGCCFEAGSLQGLKNILAMTADDGFIFLTNGVRNINFRSNFAALGLKYIEYALANNEFGSDPDAYYIIIPKDQTLDFNKFQRSFSQLPKTCRDMIDHYVHDRSRPMQRPEKLDVKGFCKLNFLVDESNREALEKLNSVYDSNYNEYRTIAKIKPRLPHHQCKLDSLCILFQFLEVLEALILGNVNSLVAVATYSTLTPDQRKDINDILTMPIVQVRLNQANPSISSLSTKSLFSNQLNEVEYPEIKKQPKI